MSTEWKLVPMHPTEEMIQATLDTGLYHDGEEAARAVLIDEYKAMVKAAPPAPQAASEPVAMLARYPAEISTAHGPWLPSRYDEGETYCERCLTRSVFADKRKCEPHIVSAPQAETSATASGDAEREALIERLKAQSLAHRYEAETDSADLIDEAVAALHSAGKPDGEVAK